MKRFAVVLPLLAVALAADRSPEGQAWWSHIEFLASDALEGRGSGTPGHTKAAEYVAARFREAGLKPGGVDGTFVQPVRLERRLLDESASSLELVKDGKTRRINLGEEANLGVTIDPPYAVEADVVFAGHCLRVPEANIDDLAGLDLKGKVAFCLSGAPSNLPGPLAAHAQSGAERWKHLQSAGVLGVISFSDPRRSDVPWERSTLRRFAPAVRLEDPALIDNVGSRLSVVVNPKHADIFLDGTGHTAEQLLELHRANKPLPRFPLKMRVRAKTAFSTEKVRSENVIGVLPGTSKEAIVISAHLDHLGIGGETSGDKIYNGAMDNASGVASVIEMARVLSKRKLKRTIIFAAVTGEEGGLMGSKTFATYPTVQGTTLVADINLDMFLPIVPLKALTVLGIDESDLGPQFVKVASKFDVRAERDPEPARNLFIRSDQYSFIRRGVPSITFKFHAQPGTPEAKVMSDWLRERYHAPSDDLQQPVNVEAAVTFNRLIAAFIEDVANRQERPSWNKESFFRRYAPTN
jgi:hypothetical protein